MDTVQIQLDAELSSVLNGLVGMAAGASIIFAVMFGGFLFALDKNSGDQRARKFYRKIFAIGLIGSILCFGGSLYDMLASQNGRQADQRADRLASAEAQLSEGLGVEVELTGANLDHWLSYPSSYTSEEMSGPNLELLYELDGEDYRLPIDLQSVDGDGGYRFLVFADGSPVIDRGSELKPMGISPDSLIPTDSEE